MADERKRVGRWWVWVVVVLGAVVAWQLFNIAIGGGTT